MHKFTCVYFNDLITEIVRDRIVTINQVPYVTTNLNSNDSVCLIVLLDADLQFGTWNTNRSATPIQTIMNICRYITGVQYVNVVCKKQLRHQKKKNLPPLTFTERIIMYHCTFNFTLYGNIYYNWNIIVKAHATNVKFGAYRVRTTQYSETCLERPLPWETTCLDRPHIFGRRTYISI